MFCCRYLFLVKNPTWCKIVLANNTCSTGKINLLSNRRELYFAGRNIRSVRENQLAQHFLRKKWQHLKLPFLFFTHLRQDYYYTEIPACVGHIYKDNVFIERLAYLLCPVPKKTSSQFVLS